MQFFAKSKQIRRPCPRARSQSFRALRVKSAVSQKVSFHALRAKDVIVRCCPSFTACSVRKRFLPNACPRHPLQFVSCASIITTCLFNMFLCERTNSHVFPARSARKTWFPGVPLCGKTTLYNLVRNQGWFLSFDTNISFCFLTPIYSFCFLTFFDSKFNNSWISWIILDSFATPDSNASLVLFRKFAREARERTFGVLFDP